MQMSCSGHMCYVFSRTMQCVLPAFQPVFVVPPLKQGCTRTTRPADQEHWQQVCALTATCSPQLPVQHAHVLTSGVVLHTTCAQ